MRNQSATFDNDILEIFLVRREKISAAAAPGEGPLAGHSDPSSPDGEMLSGDRG